MDYSEYVATALIRQRHAELVEMARRQALARQARCPRPLRVSLGTALIRLGARLLREEYAPRVAV